MRLLDRAIAEKPALPSWQTGFSAWFVFALLLVCRRHSGRLVSGHQPERALWITVAVLVIALPLRPVAGHPCGAGSRHRPAGSPQLAGNAAMRWRRWHA